MPPPRGPTKAASAAASALYLDPSLQARLAAPTKPSGATNNDGVRKETLGATVSSGGDSGVGSKVVDRAEIEIDPVRSTGQEAKAAKETNKKACNGGPVVIMSDAENYRPDPKRRKRNRRNKCVIQ